MKISRDWLGDYVDLTDLTDEELAKRLTEIGHAVEAIQSHEGDTVFEIEFTANRVDAMCHLGLAREIAAAFGRQLLTSQYELSFAEGLPSVTRVPIRIDAPELCARFSGMVVRGVKVGPSSHRVRHRLEAVGLRSINNVVDATNYVMLAVGHPLHAYDLDRLNGGEIIVRAAKPGETMKTLDGETRKLDAESCVIADAKGGIGIGGIIGGFESEITDSTTNVLLECAWFTPAAIRRTARRFGIKTDASYRFERGVDPNDTVAAVEQAAKMVVDSAGGSPEKPIDVVAAAITPKTIRIREDHLRLASGGVVGAGYAMELFRRLGMEVTVEGDVLSAVIPTWRRDLHEEMDLAEEVLRFYGFDNIPASLPRVTTGDVAHEPLRESEEKIRDLLVGCGFAETITYAFISEERNAAMSEERPVNVTNALSETIASMRQSMIPGLMEVAAFNRSYGTRDGALFEVGKTYHWKGDEVEERPTVALAMFGSVGSHWGDPKRPVDFFDMKGVLEALLEHFHVKAEFIPTERPWMKRGQAAAVRVGDREVAVAGFLSRELLQKLDMKGDVLAAQVDTVALVQSVGAWTMAPVSRYPGVPMVVGLVHGRALSYARLLGEVRRMDVPFLHEVGVRDRYVPDEGRDEVKTTLGFWYQAEDRSLTQEEVSEIHSRLTARLAEALPVQVIGP